ncbi:MAG TPA: hypothetical protein VF670_19150 [Duganella sp.]|jgi:hypothetical protein
MKTVLVACGFAGGLTYLSLLVPGSFTAVCSNIGKPIYCPVLAYGFPLPFLVDNQGISPVGSVARDPLSLLVGEDDMLWSRLALAMVFWLTIVVAGWAAWRRWRRQ